MRSGEQSLVVSRRLLKVLVVSLAASAVGQIQTSYVSFCQVRHFLKQFVSDLLESSTHFQLRNYLGAWAASQKAHPGNKNVYIRCIK
jgi:hypothetical protein